MNFTNTCYINIKIKWPIKQLIYSKKELTGYTQTHKMCGYQSTLTIIWQHVYDLISHWSFVFRYIHFF